jgi:hypothetical protein
MEDIKMLNNKTRFIGPLLAFLLIALVAVPVIYATSNGLADWRNHYENSNSDDAGCQLCHGTSLGQLNTYGKDICDQFIDQGFISSDWTDTLLDIEGIDSDLDGSNNGLEIANNSQPGWTEGLNPLFSSDFIDGCPKVADDSTVPNNVPLPYDIDLGGDPIANPGGPYVALVGEMITFDGSNSTDEGDIVRYDWVFGDGTSAVDAGPNPEHAYDAEGVYNVVLTVTDNDGNTNAAGTTATISPLELLDLDIDTLKVARTGRVDKAISVKLSVENNGTVLGQAIATILGKVGGDTVYNRRLNVYDYIGKGTTNFTFADYTPEAAGTIEWTATIADEDPDDDLVTATTVVK